ncbi:MAG: metallophosphoesterase family protein [Candidatus Rifleibacteriota bacterium]
MDYTPKQNCIAIIGDPHLPGRQLELKQQVIEDINSWSEVDLVVCTGDLCATVGTEKEFSFAAEFFSHLNKPFITLIGNHDNFYSDGGYFEASASEREIKLQRFARYFPEQKLYFSRSFADYRLYFLAVLNPESPCFSSISKEQLDWFNAELEKFPDQKAIVFCHAPLWSLEVVKFYPKAFNYITQPEEEFRKIVRKNKQIALWVSGHVHFGMKKELISHPFNLYENQVFNILNTDLDGFSVLDLEIKPRFHDRIWTRKLFLDENGYSCTVYDHLDCKELPELTISGSFK